MALSSPPARRFKAISGALSIMDGEGETDRLPQLFLLTLHVVHTTMPWRAGSAHEVAGMAETSSRLYGQAAWVDSAGSGVLMGCPSQPFPQELAG